MGAQLDAPEQVDGHEVSESMAGLGQARHGLGRGQQGAVNHALGVSLEYVGFPYRTANRLGQ